MPVQLEEFAQAEKRKVWIHEKNMKAFAFHNPSNESEHLDVVIESRIDFKKAYAHREVVRAGDLKILLIGIPDLIKMKRSAGRARDRIDIEALEAIQELKNDQKKR